MKITIPNQFMKSEESDERLEKNRWLLSAEWIAVDTIILGRSINEIHFKTEI